MIDVAVATAAPLAALSLRHVEIATRHGMILAAGYVAVSLICSLLAFQIFRIDSIIPAYMSASDLLKLLKAAVFSQLLAVVILFTTTRLDGIPRAVPVIQTLLLAAGLGISRGLVVIAQRRRRLADRPSSPPAENVILIGLNDLSVVLLKYLRAVAAVERRVVAVLDENPRWIGRHVHGVPVCGPPSELGALVEEFTGHGVETDWVVVAGAPGILSKKTEAEVEAVCRQRGIALGFVPDLLTESMTGPVFRGARRAPPRREPCHCPAALRASRYATLKRLIDIVGSLGLLLWLTPLLILTGGIVLLDVGWPVLFWQLRAGRGGREVQIYKFRTLRTPFNRQGQRICEDDRLSWIGRLLRQTRIDELPQLLNVLVGDMSLIGPRPLLPQDQPPDATVRLSVRPGITGWAQVNGATSLSPSEKEALDAWYIRHASLWLDLRIIGLTLLLLVRGERRSAAALAQARYRPAEPFAGDAKSARSAALPRLAESVARTLPEGARRAAELRSR